MSYKESAVLYSTYFPSWRNIYKLNKTFEYQTVTKYRP